MSHQRLKVKYRFIKSAPEKEKQEHDKLKKQLKNKQKSLAETFHNTYRKDYKL